MLTRTAGTTLAAAGLVAGGALVGPTVIAPETSGTVAAAQSVEDRRQNIIDRAKHWTDQGVPYDMTKYAADPDGVNYRTDCSGFVSMAWGLDTSLSTVTLPEVAHEIPKDDLQPGDILLKGGPGTAGAAGHVTIFNGWANAERTAYHGLEQAGGTGAVERVISYPYEQDASYVPYRGNGL